MKYQVPRCECGEKLKYWEEVMYEITTPITSSGHLSTKGIIKTSTGVTGAYERLQCEKCLNDYDIKRDDKNRIIRGNNYKWQ